MAYLASGDTARVGGCCGARAMSAVRASNSAINTRSSSRASGAPGQTWMPAPYSRFSAGSRSMRKSSGASKARGSRLAAIQLIDRRSPAAKAWLPNSTAGPAPAAPCWRRCRGTRVQSAACAQAQRSRRARAGRRCAGAGRSRWARRGGRHLDGVHHGVVVHRQADRHAVDRLAGGPTAFAGDFKGLRLAVVQFGLDVPQAIAPAVATKHHPAVVQVRAGSGRRKGHGENLSDNGVDPDSGRKRAAAQRNHRPGQRVSTHHVRAQHAPAPHSHP